MRRFIGSLVLCWGLSTCNALADPGSVNTPDEPFFGTAKAQGVLQNPTGIISTTQTAVQTLQPSVEEFYSFNDGWFTGSTVSLWNFSDHQVPIASLRAGYGGVAKLIGEVKLDASGITQQYLLPIVPDPIKSALTFGILNDGWHLVNRYGQFAVFTGYDFEHHDNSDKRGGFIYGISLGGSF